MITALEIGNFKCFQRLRLTFGQLTLLTGFNGGGKSSAVQPLLLLSQGLRISTRPEAFALNGPLVRLGTAGDVLPSGAEHAAVEFALRASDCEAAWLLTTRSSDRFLRLKEFTEQSNPENFRPKAQANEHEGDSSGLLDNLAKLTYLSAIREGTADAYPIPDVASEEFNGIGVDGRFAPYWYDQLVDNEIPELRRHRSEPATSLRKQLDAWIATLFPGAQANVQLLPQVSLLSLQFRLSDFGPWRRPANIGYGLTYAFPIIVALLAAASGQIIVIDSPEAHLHPMAQSQMGRLLAHFAAAGVQILVETHSDHLLNGARLAVKDGVLPSSALKIHFFSGVTNEGHGVISPTLDGEGRLDEWPQGFFDQAERDLSRLAGWG